MKSRAHLETAIAALSNELLYGNWKSAEAMVECATALRKTRDAWAAIISCQALVDRDNAEPEEER